jgi:methylated-DNA-[protein]-cysteine S-methyltransferase
MTCYTILKTSGVGDLLLVSNAKQLTGVYFRDCEHVPAMPDEWKFDPAQPVLLQAEAELQEYLTGARTAFSVPLHYAGTDFQNEIWRQIALIPFGETVTYTELARRAGAPEAVRAAGTAAGKNPLGIIIPCHRVVGKHGALGGYAGGLKRKQHLLALEKSYREKPGSIGTAGFQTCCIAGFQTR